MLIPDALFPDVDVVPPNPTNVNHEDLRIETNRSLLITVLFFLRRRMNKTPTPTHTNDNTAIIVLLLLATLISRDSSNRCEGCFDIGVQEHQLTLSQFKISIAIPITLRFVLVRPTQMLQVQVL